MRAAVRDGYAKVVEKHGSRCSGVSRCGSSTGGSAQLAQYVGYSPEELGRQIPQSVF